MWEEHRLLAKTDGGWVVECKSTNDAPKGDCFYVVVQLCGTHLASGRAQLRISMQVRGGMDGGPFIAACLQVFIHEKIHMLVPWQAAPPHLPAPGQVYVV